MSIESWKEEFYPTVPTKDMSEKEAVEHCSQKWKGIIKENAEKHGLQPDGVALYDGSGNSIRFCGSCTDSLVRRLNAACALCVLHFNEETETVECEQCILKDCDEEYKDARAGDYEPMFKILYEAREKLK